VKNLKVQYFNLNGQADFVWFSCRQDKCYHFQIEVCKQCATQNVLFLLGASIIEIGLSYLIMLCCFHGANTTSN